MSLANARANFAKSYRNSALALIQLIVDHVDHAKNNQHNMKELNSLYAIMQGRRDQRCFQIIVSDLCSATMKDGIFKMPKAKREYYERDYSGFKSFRTLADALDDEAADQEKDKPEFDVQKYALSILKKLQKEGVALSELENTFGAAQKELDAKAAS
ncbi:hypothetical protein [Shimia sp.]|uniref:hypothetical protein n=1 Tax=Shimia sp. TaxID=1954381 RepID=UPI003BA95195